MSDTLKPSDHNAQQNNQGGNSKRALFFILVNVGIDVIGLGIIIPVLPELIREISTMQGGSSSMSNAAIVGGWLMFAYALMQFVFAPILGNLSDRYGRRPILLWGLFWLGVDYVIMALAPTMFWLFVGRILAGMAGASHVTAYSYIADVSPKDKRAANFGLVGMAFGIGFVIGPAIGGLLGSLDPRLPFWAAAALCFANLALGYFVLPESLAKSKRRKFDIKRANPVGAFKQFLHIKPVLMLIVAATLFEFASQVYPSLWAYFTPVSYGWSTAEVGLSLAIFGILIAFGEGYLLRILLSKFGEHRVIISSIILSIACFAAFAVVSDGTAAYVVMVFAAFSGFAGSSIHGLASNHAAENVQGELNGAIMSAASIVQIIAPPLMTGIFALFTLETARVYFPGAPFILAAVLVALVIFPYLKARALGINDSSGNPEQ
jgi:DHA1 family tetracycline resistance protein-like MFS transporter